MSIIFYKVYTEISVCKLCKYKLFILFMAVRSLCADLGKIL